jgi:hypothetical protein
MERMKKILLVLPLLLLFGCNISEDCLKNSGAMQTRIIDVLPEASFSKIYVYPNISVVLSQGDENAITIKAGSNVISDISAVIENDALVLRDNSGCNLARQYGDKTVYVNAKTVPVMEIYSNTAQTIKSDGVLTFPILRLYAMDYFGGVGTGDFTINVDSAQLVVQSNNVSIFRITGETDEMLLNFYDDLSRFEGESLIAQSIKVFQRSANDMIVHPVQSITGDIYSTGNILCKTHPPVVNVEKHYTGRLIYD